MTGYVLLNPGPVNLSARVRAALSRVPELCHREPEFAELLQRVRRKVLEVYGLSPREFTAVMLTASGTGAVESALGCALGRGERALVLSNGVYGERMARMAERWHAGCRVLKFEWGEDIRAEDVEAELSRGGYSVLAAVHHETTTGVLNDVERVAALAARHGARTVIDAVSSFGAEPIDFANMDFVASTANKCLEGIPGVAFVVVRRRVLDALPEENARSEYLDLKANCETQERGIPAFTPAVPALFVLDAALDELLEEGVQRRYARYRERAEYLRSSLAAAGFELACERDRMGSTLTSVKLPEGATYEHLHDYLKERGYVIYAGQGGLRHRIWRIANMGNISRSQLERLAEILGEWKAGTTGQ